MELFHLVKDEQSGRGISKIVLVGFHRVFLEFLFFFCVFELPIVRNIFFPSFKVSILSLMFKNACICLDEYLDM